MLSEKRTFKLGEGHERSSTTPFPLSSPCLNRVKEVWLSYDSWRLTHEELNERGFTSVKKPKPQKYYLDF